MGTRNSTLFTAMTSFVLLMALGFGADALAQKGGRGNHGGGNGNGHGNGRGLAGPPQGGPPPGRGWRRDEQPQPRPQQVPGWASRPARQPEYQQRVYQPQVMVPQIRVQTGPSKQEWKQERKAEKMAQRGGRNAPQVVVEQPRRQGPPPWAGVWTAPGQLKKAERIMERSNRVRNYDYDDERQSEIRSYRQPVWENIPSLQPNVYYAQPQPPVTYYEEPTYPHYRVPRYDASPVVEYYPNSYYGGSAPLVNYYPSYGGENFFDIGNYYGQPDSFSLSDPFLGGVDWKNFLLSTVVNVLFGGRGGDEMFGQEGSALGSLFGRNFGSLDYSPIGYPDPSYDYGYPEMGGVGREIYDAGYEQGVETGRQAILSGEDLAVTEPFVMDQAGFGYGAEALDLEQRRILNQGFAQGYQDAVSNSNDLAVNDDGQIDWTSAIVGGLLSLFNG